MMAAIFLSAGSLEAQTSSPTPYCAATNNYTTLYYSGQPCTNPLSKLARVQLNTLDHSDACANVRGVYTFWNNVSATQLDPGANYDMTLTSGMTNNYVNEYGVWIDFNGDGDFADAGEFLFRGESTGSGSSITRNIAIPCSAVAGQTRMRVRIDYDYNGSSYNYNQSHACGNSCYGNNGYGETWDFTVNISSTTAPNANYTVPDTIYTNSPTRFLNANRSGYVKHYWDVIGAGNTPDDSTLDFNYTFPSAGTYQLRLTSINCQGQDIETKTVTVVNPTSSPMANFVTSDNQVTFDGSTLIVIDFYDLSQYGPTTWEWIMDPDWLNGAPFFWNGTNYEQNPTGLFYDVEDYNVCLVVGNSAGTDTLCKSNYIQIVPPGGGSAGANVENTMGVDANSTLDSGIIYDSGGPNGQYKNNEFNTFTIKPCGATSITLSFDAYDTENGYDYLRVYDGPNSSYPQIANLNGNSIPNPITATSGAMTLVFTSDGSVTRNGFIGRWEAVVPPAGNPMADFVLPDTVFQCAAGNDLYFENTSMNVPNGSTFDWIFDYDPLVSYPNGYADINDEVNPEWQYTSAKTYQVRMTLNSCAGNDTAVKSFVLAPSVGNPDVDFVSSERILKVGGMATLTSQTRNSCKITWDIFPTTYTLENGSTLNDREIYVKFTNPGSYNVKLTSENDNGQTVEEKTNYIDVISYCSPAVNIPSVADVGITRVKFNTIDNESDAGKDGGYKNYTDDFSTSVILGETYSIEVERGSNVNAVNRKVWIDYNRDGDFDDANEMVASVSGATAKNFTGSFTIPGLMDGVVPGESRMRVAIGLVNTSLEPCGPTLVGEYEDYTVFLTLDNIAPIITMTGGDTTIEVNTSYSDPGVTAFDNIEGLIDPLRIMTNNGVDTSQSGIYFVTYSVSDKSGNPAIVAVRKVTVVGDLTPPTLTLNGSTPFLHSVLIPYVDPMATSVDMPGNNTSLVINTSGTVDVNTIGDYVITYEVTDYYGNTSTATRTVQVRDTTAPDVNANATYQIQVGQPFVRPFNPADNFDQNPALTVVNNVTVNTAVIGSYVVEYAVVDASGNAGQNMTVTYEVADYVAPVIAHVDGTDEVYVNVYDNDWMKKPGMKVTASDNYYINALLEIVYPSDYSIDSVGTYVITYKATDNAGNVSTFSRTVHVVDVEKPVVLTNPLNLPRWAPAYDFMTGVNVKDNYYQPLDFLNNQKGCELLIVRSNVDQNYPGLYQVVYVARDGSGNLSDETTRLVVIAETALTGIEGADLANSMNVYPNPNNGQFTLEVNAVLGANTEVKVVNAVGTVIQTIDASELIANGKVSVDMNTVTPGVYFIQIIDNGQVATKKVVITK